MLVNVEPFFFHTLVYPESDGGIYYLEEDEGDYGTEHNRYQRCYNLNPKLVPIAVQRSLNSVLARNEAGGKYTGQDRAYDTAYAVYAESIERIVIFELRLDDRNHKEADNRGDDADAERS